MTQASSGRDQVCRYVCEPYVLTYIRVEIDYAYVLRLVRQFYVMSFAAMSLSRRLQRLVPEEGDTRHEGLTAVGVPGRIYSVILDTSKRNTQKLSFQRS